MSAREQGVDGERLSLTAAIHDSPDGPLLVAMTQRGICTVRFVASLAADPVKLLHHIWPAARVHVAPASTTPVMAALEPHGAGATLHVRGTAFQFAVWQALLRIAPGTVTSYARLAAAIGCPGGARAVGGAVAANPVALLIPCHRVVRETGATGGYAWGVARKEAILRREGVSQST